MKKSQLSPHRKVYNTGMTILLHLSAILTCALLIFIIGYICYKGVPGISLEFLTTSESVLKGTTGILPAIYNPLYVIILSLIIVLPLGVGAAIYLTEYARIHYLIFNEEQCKCTIL